MTETEEQRAARYALRDVTDKLGIKPGAAVAVYGRGKPDMALVARVRKKTGRALASKPIDVALYWPQSADEVTATLRELRQVIARDGAIWVISAKRGTPDAHRPYLPDTLLIPLGKRARLVDNKICSIDDTQTAMRFVIPKKDR